MIEQEIKNIIRRELPNILQDPEFRDFVLRTVSDYYASKQDTESRFEQILAELRQDRLEQASKWEEQNCKWEEQNRKWEEQNRKWDETQQQLQRMQEQIEQTLLEIKRLDSRQDRTIGALGARWGLYAEEAFRNALKGILQGSFGVEVLTVTEYDDHGEVFGRPDQIELDLIIKNGLLIICEIKSSVSKPDIYAFEKKVRFYQNRHQRTANRKLVISPMVVARAQEIAKELGMEVYSGAGEVQP